MNIEPRLEKARELARDFSLIPVWREIYADLSTPIMVLRKIAARSGRYFLLESVEGGERWGRYSFLGYDPVLRVFCRDNVVRVEGEETAEVRSEKPLEVVRALISTRRAPRVPGLPPFAGGFVGYFAYSVYAYSEPVLKLKRGDFCDFDLMMFRKIIAFDHLRQKIFIIVNVGAEDLEAGYKKAVAEIEDTIEMIARAPLPPQPPGAASGFACNVSKEAYCAMVEKTKRYIAEGDIFQAVISRRFESDFSGSLLSAYRVLRTTNPSPYMVFMRIDDLELMCSSPETLVRLQGGRLSTFPVAGSRPRGETEEEDRALERELLSDEKELAEHNMLVDLARNDLGRISKISSVRVVDYMMVHKYSRIMHIASRVEGDIKDGLGAVDAIEAVLPAGTLSGAPKIRACEIIDEVEGAPRGIYGGALGYIDFTGNMDTCIAIRMAVKKGGRVTVQAGGGIVADSVPEREYEESGNKAMAVIDAVMRAKEADVL